MRSSGASERILGNAVELLMEWENGGSTLDACLDSLRADDTFVEKAAVASLLFEYFRHKGFVDRLISRHAKKDGIKQDLRLVLGCAMTQILFQTGIATHSAVNVAVEYAKSRRGQGGGGFVNAMLRSMLRDQTYERENIPPSFPDVLKKRWERDFDPATADRLVSLYASNPPLSFRLRGTLSQEELDSIGAKAMDPAPDFAGPFRFFEVADPAPLFRSGYLENASLYIQDPATALCMSLLKEPVSGRVLDACAAPGGKTIMLYDRAEDPANLNLTASDRSAPRLVQMNLNLRRAGIRCRSVEAEAQNMPFSPGSFDLVLADLPCSNTGVIRRRPDAPWRFHTKRLAEVVALQQEILDSLAAQVRAGGVLLYSTCSIERDEDSVQVEHFLEAHPEYSLEDQRLLLPDAHHDGAFAALLRKQS